ncbi:MAG TPA: hypothetical protein VET24_09580, partial [Actinomycetota bacterium]|nr:hypothetical protein [Actinomycetota bacterium]
TAAASLARLDDPRAVEALVRTLNDYTDEAHSGMSLSAYALIGLGTRIAPVVVPLLASDDQITRTRAVAILRKLASGDEALAPLGRILDGYDPTVTPEASAAPARSAAEWVERNLQ